jgi:hypothetical protein
MSVTFSTCWYVLKAKFDPTIYAKWMENMLSNVNTYNLVIYSDESSARVLKPYLQNPRIKLILKPIESFYNYKYKDFWIENHKKNHLLRERVDWQVNMLWAEKTAFVLETKNKQYFDTDYYGWCDIGYFRGEPTDLDRATLSQWPNPAKIEKLDPSRIYYACVNNDRNYIDKLFALVQNKTSAGLPRFSIPENQVSIAGGFFVAHQSKVDWWKRTFDDKLALYFQYGYLVKDDQIIVVDCAFSDPSHFELCMENNPRYNNWFLFQRFLI